MLCCCTKVAWGLIKLPIMLSSLKYFWVVLYLSAGGLLPTQLAAGADPQSAPKEVSTIKRTAPVLYFLGGIALGKACMWGLSSLMLLPTGSNTVFIWLGGLLLFITNLYPSRGYLSVATAWFLAFLHSLENARIEQRTYDDMFDATLKTLAANPKEYDTLPKIKKVILAQSNEAHGSDENNEPPACGDDCLNKRTNFLRLYELLDTIEDGHATCQKELEEMQATLDNKDATCQDKLKEKDKDILQNCSNKMRSFLETERTKTEKRVRKEEQKLCNEKSQKALKQQKEDDEAACQADIKQAVDQQQKKNEAACQPDTKELVRQQELDERACQERLNSLDCSAQINKAVNDQKAADQIACQQKLATADEQCTGKIQELLEKYDTSKKVIWSGVAVLGAVASVCLLYKLTQVYKAYRARQVPPTASVEEASQQDGERTSLHLPEQPASPQQEHQEDFVPEPPSPQGPKQGISWVLSGLLLGMALGSTCVGAIRHVAQRRPLAEADPADAV